MSAIETSADRALVAAGLARDAAAERAIERAIRRAASGAARRLSLGAGGADEITQRVAEQMWLGRSGAAPALASYTGEAPLVAWLTIIAYREGMKLLRGPTPAGDDELLARVVGATAPALAIVRRGHLEVFKRCFAAALGGLSIADRDVLRRHLLDDLSLDELGRLHGVHRATAARWLARLRARLLDGTRAALRRELGGEVELDDLLATIGSRLEASLSRQLAAAP